MSAALLPVLPVPVLSLEHGRILTAVLTGLAPNSRRVYTRHLKLFLDALTSQGSQGGLITRETVTAHLAKLDQSTYNQALSAIKRLSEQAAEHGWISWPNARTITSIPSRKSRGTFAGHWLTLDEATALVALPDKTLIGKRDKAVLSLMLGCGLRRSEVAALSLEQFVSRDKRAMLANVLGKGNRLRTIGVPGWAATHIQTWITASEITSGLLIRSFKQDGEMRDSISASGIWDMVLHYAALCGVTCTPHDLRRTFAKLARKAKAPLEVIQNSLGHSSISTTERYLNTGEESSAGDWFAL